jgi:DNA-binding beta-propeller fold protein YncE
MFIAALVVAFVIGPWGSLLGLDNHLALAYAMQSDINHDGIVDEQDLIIFSSRYLKQNSEDVNWCLWLEDDENKYLEKQQLGELIDFIRVYFQCGQEDPLTVKNAIQYPTRLAFGPYGKLFVSDAKVGSVFIYDDFNALNLVGELKGLDKPLGVVVDAQGNIYVGNNGRDNVEIYGPDGVLITSLGEGIIKMPNGLAFDQSGILYVTDSRANVVLKFDSATGELLGSIGVGELRFPTAVAVANGEVYVADQGNNLVRIFDLQGNLLRSLGGDISSGMMGYKWQGRFVRLQSVAVDASGRVHALDSHMCIIQILDAVNGVYIDSYGTEGTDPGQLRLPLGILIDGAEQTIVANAGNKRVEVFSTTP